MSKQCTSCGGDCGRTKHCNYGTGTGSTTQDVRAHVRNADMKLAENDRNHPYVKKLIGCGHGRLFTEPCVDCEIVGLWDEYKNAIRKVQRTRNRLRALGVKLPGNTSATQQQERSDADQA